jgi:hypothetical protein
LRVKAFEQNSIGVCELQRGQNAQSEIRNQKLNDRICPRFSPRPSGHEKVEAKRYNANQKKHPAPGTFWEPSLSKKSRADEGQFPLEKEEKV